MFFDKVLKQTVDILKSRVDDFSNSMHNWWSNLDSVRNKVNGLYKLDFYNTERPKVDILSDTVAKENTNVWNAISELRKKISKLEEK